MTCALVWSCMNKWLFQPSISTQSYTHLVAQLGGVQAEIESHVAGAAEPVFPAASLLSTEDDADAGTEQWYKTIVKLMQGRNSNPHTLANTSCCFWETNCGIKRTSSYLVDPASSHMLVLKIKPCMSKYKHLYRETANGSLKQLWFI